MTGNTGSLIIQSMVGQPAENIKVAVLDEIDAKNIESIARIQLKCCWTSGQDGPDDGGVRGRDGRVGQGGF